ncbi:hypothetical protein ACFOHS_19975 [Jhaorihella thermophila]
MLEDGRLEVRFHAGGWLEMAWHLYQWGDSVEVVAPPRRWRGWSTRPGAAISTHFPDHVSSLFPVSNIFFGAGAAPCDRFLTPPRLPHPNATAAPPAAQT